MLIYTFRCNSCGDTQEFLVNNAGSVNMFACRRCGSPDLELLIADSCSYFNSSNHQCPVRKDISYKKDGSQ